MPDTMTAAVHVSDCSRRNAAALGAQLHSAIDSATDGDVRVDLSQVAALDADGLCAIITAAKSAAAAGKRLRMVAPTGPVRRRLALLGIDVYADAPALART